MAGFTLLLQRFARWEDVVQIAWTWGAATLVSATDEEKNVKMPLIFSDVSEVQEAVKAAQLVLKDVRAIFSEKAAAQPCPEGSSQTEAWL